MGGLATAALTIGGTFLDVAGTLQAGEAASAQAEAQSAQAEVEAKLAEGQAIQEELRGVEEERLRREAGEELSARQRAQFAKGGVRVGEGTPLLVLADTLLDTTEDIQAIQQTTEAAASAFRSQAQTFRLQALTFRGVGAEAEAASRIEAGTSLISGLSSLTI